MKSRLSTTQANSNLPIDGTEFSKKIQKKVQDHQKKIYKSIEQSIIDNAKKNRERFDLI